MKVLSIIMFIYVLQFIVSNYSIKDSNHHGLNNSITNKIDHFTKLVNKVIENKSKIREEIDGNTYDMYYTFAKSSCGHSFLVKRKLANKISIYLNENGYHISNIKAISIDENYKNNEIYSNINLQSIDFSPFEFNIFIKNKVEKNSKFILIGSSDMNSVKYNKILSGENGYIKEEELKKFTNFNKTKI